MLINRKQKNKFKKGMVGRKARETKRKDKIVSNNCIEISHSFWTKQYTVHIAVKVNQTEQVISALGFPDYLKAFKLP